MNNRKATLLLFTLSTYVNSALGLLRDVLLLSVLDSSQLGIWRVFLTVQANSKYLAVGLPGTLVYRALPMGKVDSYLRSIFPIILCYMLLLLPFFLLIFWNVLPESVKNIEFLTLLAVLCVLVVATNLVNSIYTASKDFKALIAMQLMPPIVVLAIFFFNSDITPRVMIWSLAAGSSCSLLFFNKDVRGSLHFYKVWRYVTRFKVLSSLSIKIMLPSFAFTLFQTVDVVMVGALLGAKEVGQLSISLTFASIAGLASMVFSTFVFVNDPGKIKESRSYMYRMSGINFFVGVGVCLVGYFFAVYVIKEYLQQHTEALIVLSAIAFSVPFLALRNLTITYIITKGAELKFSFMLVLLIVFKLLMFKIFYQEYWYFVIMIFNVFFGLFCIFYPLLVNKER